MNYEIVDNLLPQEELTALQGILTCNEFPWYYQEVVTSYNSAETERAAIENFYFSHQIMWDYVKSPFFDIVRPILARLEHRSLIRVKANLYPRTSSRYSHHQHTDYPFSHPAALFYVNTNDGFTVLEDGTEVESIANRLLLFDGGTLHNSTTCTDSKSRININFNYF